MEKKENNNIISIQELNNKLNQLEQNERQTTEVILGLKSAMSEFTNSLSETNSQIIKSNTQIQKLLIESKKNDNKRFFVSIFLSIVSLPFLFILMNFILDVIELLT